MGIFEGKNLLFAYLGMCMRYWSKVGMPLAAASLMIYHVDNVQHEKTITISISLNAFKYVYNRTARRYSVVSFSLFAFFRHNTIASACYVVISYRAS